MKKPRFTNRLGSGRREAISRRAAFTLAELIVVITIIVLLIGIGVPAFSSAVASSEKSLAENQLRIGIAGGRIAAQQSPGADTCAYFQYNAGGRLTIIPCVMVGTIKDLKDPAAGPNRPGNIIARDVFVPLPGVKPVQLPKNWMVRAFAPPGTLDNTALPTGERSGWYIKVNGGRAYAPAEEGNWIFPETGFYAGAQTGATRPTAAQASFSGVNRNSFIVRFKAGEASVNLANNDLAIVIDPSPDSFHSTESPWSDPWNGDPTGFRTDKKTDLVQYVRRVLAANDLSGDYQYSELVDEPIRRQLFCWTGVGPQASSDRVLVRPVTELALYNEVSLLRAVQGRVLNAATGTIYGGDPTYPGDVPARPMIDVSNFSTPPVMQDLHRNINAWIEGRLHDPPTAVTDISLVPSDARVFTMQRYLGQSQEVVP